MDGRLLAWATLGLLVTLLGHPVAAQNFPYSEPLEFSALESESGESEPDEIETDRDSFTPATSTAAFRRLIVESAWSFINNRAVPDTNSLPELIVRYGVNDWLELRLGWNYEAGGAANTISGGGGEPEVPTEGEVERESQISYGLKAALTYQPG